jgi:hypothetical protein
MQENIKNKKTDNTPSGDGGKSYWNKWYIAVVLFLIVQIIIFYFITKSFS